MNKRDNILIFAAIILIGLTSYFLYRGCTCGVQTQNEGFENKMDMALDEDEEDLFEDLKKDKYTAKEIDDLVAKGVIDQNLVEKFLNKLDNFEAETAKKSTKTKKVNQKRK